VSVHTLSASGDKCPVLVRGDKSCGTGPWLGGDKQLLGGPAYLLLGWTGSAPNALASWLTLAIRVGTAWHALVCTGVLRSPGTASGLRALMTLSSARGSLPLFPAVLQISSKEPV